MMLKESRDNCDYLIVGLNVNPCKNGNFPMQNVVERYTQLKSVNYVDEIIPYNSESELIDLLELYNPDVRFIGGDYLDKPFTGDELPIEVFYNSRNHRFSSSTLKQHVVDEFNKNIMDGDVIKDNDTYKIIDNIELNGLTVSTTLLKPLKSTSGHKHDDIEEVYYFIKGSGMMVLGENEFTVATGSTITIPSGVFHRVINESVEEDLVFICTFNSRRNH
jgi:glycerol-3-phosphate cytidylyltransferase